MQYGDSWYEMVVQELVQAETRDACCTACAGLPERRTIV